jgi:hypothetical protein
MEIFLQDNESSTGNPNDNKLSQDEADTLTTTLRIPM